LKPSSIAHGKRPHTAKFASAFGGISMPSTAKLTSMPSLRAAISLPSCAISNAIVSPIRDFGDPTLRVSQSKIAIPPDLFVLAGH